MSFSLDYGNLKRSLLKVVLWNIDIYCYNQNDLDQKHPICKEYYFIILDQETDDALLVRRRFRDNEHWIRQLSDLTERNIVIYS